MIAGSPRAITPSGSQEPSGSEFVAQVVERVVLAVSLCDQRRASGSNEIMVVVLGQLKDCPDPVDLVT